MLLSSHWWRWPNKHSISLFSLLCNHPNHGSEDSTSSTVRETKKRGLGDKVRSQVLKAINELTCVNRTRESNKKHISEPIPTSLPTAKTKTGKLDGTRDDEERLGRRSQITFSFKKRSVLISIHISKQSKTNKPDFHLSRDDDTEQNDLNTCSGLGDYNIELEAINNGYLVELWVCSILVCWSVILAPMSHIGTTSLQKKAQPHHIEMVGTVTSCSRLAVNIVDVNPANAISRLQNKNQEGTAAVSDDYLAQDVPLESRSWYVIELWALLQTGMRTRHFSSSVYGSGERIEIKSNPSSSPSHSMPPQTFQTTIPRTDPKTMKKRRMDSHKTKNLTPLAESKTNDHSLVAINTVKPEVCSKPGYAISTHQNHSRLNTITIPNNIQLSTWCPKKPNCSTRRSQQTTDNHGTPQPNPATEDV